MDNKIEHYDGEDHEEEPDAQRQSREDRQSTNAYGARRKQTACIEAGRETAWDLAAFIVGAAEHKPTSDRSHRSISAV